MPETTRSSSHRPIWFISFIQCFRPTPLFPGAQHAITRQRIYALTMSEVIILILVLAGLLGGWAASLLIGRVVRTLLYGVKETDGGVAVIVATLFLLAATLAAFLPARRAATIDPMEALRTE